MEINSYLYDFIVCLIAICISLIATFKIWEITVNYSIKTRTIILFYSIFLLNFIIGLTINAVQIHHIISIPPEKKDEGIYNIFFVLVASSTILDILALNIRYLMEIKKKKAELQDKERANLEMKLKLLQSYINPHFLFNCLSTLGGLVEENPVKAVDFVDRLSLILRFMLQNRDKKVVTIQEELENLNNYLTLMNIRYGDEVLVNISDSLKASQIYICPGILQILVENAIKHNIHSTSNPLEINIDVNDKEITVSNTLQPMTSSFEYTSFGIGLDSVKTRIESLSVGGVRNFTRNNYFVVAIPKITDW